MNKPIKPGFLKLVIADFQFKGQSPSLISGLCNTMIIFINYGHQEDGRTKAIQRWASTGWEDEDDQGWWQEEKQENEGQTREGKWGGGGVRRKCKGWQSKGKGKIRAGGDHGEMRRKERNTKRQWVPWQQSPLKEYSLWAGHSARHSVPFSLILILLR